MTTMGPCNNTCGCRLDDIIAFWSSHGPDWQYGGFHGMLDRRVRGCYGQQSRVLTTAAAGTLMVLMCGSLLL